MPGIFTFRVERVEHEGVVGIRAVSDAKSACDDLSKCGPPKCGPYDEAGDARQDSPGGARGLRRERVSQGIWSTTSCGPPDVQGAVYTTFRTRRALPGLVDEFSARLAEAMAAASPGAHGGSARCRPRSPRGSRRSPAPGPRPHPAAGVGEPGAAYQSKRLEVHGRFASLIQAYLDDAVAEGSIPPLDTRVAPWRGWGR